jgi:tRNA G18 (ribose-2'-O)-methylase SpoU
MKLNAKELRDVPVEEIQAAVSALKRVPLYLILENVYDTYNIGGLFRLADALAVEKMYLCGEMEIPPNHRIAKASIGTYKVVPWEYCATAQIAIEQLRQTWNVEHGTPLSVYAVEQDEASIPYTDVEYSLPIALIVGNETFGVTEETKKLADKIIEIPMWGINKSLNVIVSAAIVSYHVMEKNKMSTINHRT